MLTKELLHFSTRQGRIKPRFIDPDKWAAPGVGRGFGGDGSRRRSGKGRASWRSRCWPWRRPRPKRSWATGLVKLVLDQGGGGGPQPGGPGRTPEGSPHGQRHFERPPRRHHLGRVSGGPRSGVFGAFGRGPGRALRRSTGPAGRQGGPARGRGGAAAPLQPGLGPEFPALRAAGGRRLGEPPQAGAAPGVSVAQVLSLGRGYRKSARQLADLGRGPGGDVRFGQTLWPGPGDVRGDLADLAALAIERRGRVAAPAGGHLGVGPKTGVEFAAAGGVGPRAGGGREAPWPSWRATSCSSWSGPPNLARSAWGGSWCRTWP
jgi:hypothetical protein